MSASAQVIDWPMNQLNRQKPCNIQMCSEVPCLSGAAIRGKLESFHGFWFSR
jgi:hypothetical protein